MCEIKPVYTLRLNGAIIKQFQFDNGYGASVHKPPGEFFWQLGVTAQPDDELLENTPAFRGSIMPRLTDGNVQSMLRKIHDLESRLS